MQAPGIAPRTLTEARMFALDVRLDTLEAWVSILRLQTHHPETPTNLLP